MFKYAIYRLPTNVSKPIQIDLPISHAGAFAYWVEYDSDSNEERVKGREGYFNIDPVLRVQKRSPILSDDRSPLSAQANGGKVLKDQVNIPMDGLAILTVVAKWMGTLDEWRPHLKEASERGYNMLHYTPLQQRGSSGSPYSLADFLSYDLALFEPGWNGTREEGVKRVQEMMKIAKEEYGLLGCTDVVLNHTANNSAWLLDHPEAGRLNIFYLIRILPQ